MVLGKLTAAVLLTTLATRPLGAQTAVNSPLWRWVDAQGGFCIWYFADPEIARKLLPSGMVPRTARETSGLPDILIRIAQDEPRFADWVPGLVCVGRFAVVAANGVPIARMDKEEHPVGFTLSALATRMVGGDSTVQWRLLELGLRAGDLGDVGEDLGIPSEDRELWVRRGVEGEDTQWSLELDDAKLAWTGHPSGPSRVGETRSMLFGYAGDRDREWRVEVRLAPTGEQDQVGSLRVEGDGPLAKALQSSPIRAMGALSDGGEVTMTFVLEPRSRK